MADKRSIKIGEKIMHRVLVNQKDVHYPGGLVNGPWVLSLFGDVGTELSVRYDGDDGLLRAYKNTELLAPIAAGDLIEAVGWIEKVGNTSRTTKLEAYRVMEIGKNPEVPSEGNYLDGPVLVARCTIIGVVQKHLQRFNA